MKAHIPQVHHLSPDVTDNLELVEVPMPDLLPGHVLVKIHAAALNYRDLLCVAHSPIYPSPLAAGFSPLSDGAGTVAAVAEGSRWAVGDRVLLQPNTWLQGTDARDFDISKCFGGTDVHGTLREYMLLPEDRLIAAPSSLTLEEVASLRTAATTAVYALFFGPAEGGRIGEGDTVLTQGTGGVSSFAIQVGVSTSLIAEFLISRRPHLPSAHLLSP